MSETCGDKKLRASLISVRKDLAGRKVLTGK